MATAAALAATALPAIAASPGDPFRAAAQKAAGADLAPLYRQFCGLAPPAPAKADDALPPTRIFDNLVLLGREKWDSWALLTSDGIILFDSLETNAEAERFIVGGLRTLGLDPAMIRYVVVMHGHGDHFGGAKLIHDRFGARVLMSDADWKFVAETVKAGKLHADQPAPDRGLVITDGMTLTLGDTKVRLFLTPGHTPGTASALIPLKDGTATHLAGYWGGTGFDPPRTPLDTYLGSIAKWRGISKAAGVDVALSNHPTNDVTLMRLPALAARRPGMAHPFVLGAAGYQRVLATLEGCVKAAKAEKDAK